MVAYFMRLLAGGVLRWFAATFILFTLLIYWPGSILNWVQPGVHGYSTTPFLERLSSMYKLDKPWPQNYATWLFDSQDTVRVIDRDTRIAKGVDLTIFDLEVQGSGILTGDFGESVTIARGKTPLELYGLSFDAFLVITLVPIPLLMLIAVRQRIDRRPLRGISVREAILSHNVEPLRMIG